MASSVCRNPKCKKPIRQPAKGRKRDYCSDRCKEAARPRRDRSSPHKEIKNRPPASEPRRGALAKAPAKPGPAFPGTIPESRPAPLRDATLLGAPLIPDSGAVCHTCHGPGGKGALPICDDCHAELNP